MFEPVKYELQMNVYFSLSTFGIYLPNTGMMLCIRMHVERFMVLETCSEAMLNVEIKCK